MKTLSRCIEVFLDTVCFLARETAKGINSIEEYAYRMFDGFEEYLRLKKIIRRNRKQRKKDDRELQKRVAARKEQYKRNDRSTRP